MSPKNITSTRVAVTTIITVLWLWMPYPQGVSLPLGNDFQRLTPSSSGIDFISIESSYPTPEGAVIIGSSMVHSVSVLPVIIEPGIRTQRSVDTLTTAHQHLSIGLGKNVEISAQFPVTIYAASLDHPSDKGDLSSPGLLYAGAGAKFRFHKKHHYEFALGTELGTDLMDNNPYSGDTMSLLTNVYISATAEYNPVILGFNLGYKFRTTGDAIATENTNIPIQPIPHTLIFATGIRYSTAHYGALIAELYGSHALIDDSRNQTDRSATSIEALVGYSRVFASGFGIKAAGGAEILKGIGTAQYRILAGIDYQFPLNKIAINTPSTNSTKNTSIPKKPQPKQSPKTFDNWEDELEQLQKEDAEKEEENPDDDDEVDYPTF
ncbi:MAG: hypothetical protein OXC44_05315 [Proteobacteria bacterium]|nr:hypothetical protein [Pseudomonadota bacterium]